MKVLTNSTKKNGDSSPKNGVSKTAIKDVVHLVLRNRTIDVFDYIKLNKPRKAIIKCLFDLCVSELKEEHTQKQMDKLDKSYLYDKLLKAVQAKLPVEDYTKYAVPENAEQNSFMDYLDNILPNTLRDVIKDNQITRIKMNAGRIEIDFNGLFKNDIVPLTCKVINQRNGKSHYYLAENKKNGNVYVDTIK